MQSERLAVLQNHLQPQSTTTTTTTSFLNHAPVSNASKKNDDDIVIICPVRTAICRANRGGFKDTPPDALLAPVLKHIMQTTKIDPKLIGDVVIGKVLGASSQGAAQIRIASFLAGIPEEVPCQTVNRQCSSGLQAIASVAAAIKGGFYECGIAGGVESMTIGGKGMVWWIYCDNFFVDSMGRSR